MLWRGRQKSGDVAAGRKMLADRAQHDDAHALVLAERFEHGAQLVALRHFDDVERRPIEHHVGALARGVGLEAKAVECVVFDMPLGKRFHAAVPCWRASGASPTYSPAMSFLRNSLPTGDFGISATKT